MEAGELARVAGQDKVNEAALAEGHVPSVREFSPPSGPLTGPHGGAVSGTVPAASTTGYDKISNFNADTNLYNVKSENVSESVSNSVSHKTRQTNSPILSLPEPLSPDALPTPLAITGVVIKEENKMVLESDDMKEISSNSPSSTSGLAASVEAQSRATESYEEAVDAADGDADAARGQYPVDGSDQTAVSAADEVEVEQSCSGQNKVNERAKRKFDDLDIVHSNDVCSRRDVTMEKKPVSELDEVGTEFSTLHTAERSINLFREI